MELSNDWHKRTNVRLVDILSDILKELRPPKVPKPTHGYTIAEKAPEIVTAPGAYFPVKKGEVIPLESRQSGGAVKPTPSRTVREMVETLSSYAKPRLVPRQEGGAVDPNLFKETFSVNAGAPTQEGIKTAANTALINPTPINVSPPVSTTPSLQSFAPGADLTPTVSSAPLTGMAEYEANARKMRGLPPETETPAVNPTDSRLNQISGGLGSFMPPVFKENTRSPVFGSDQRAEYDKKSKPYTGFMKSTEETPLFSRAPGGDVSPDPLEGLSEEERKRRIALLKTEIPGESIASHIPANRTPTSSPDNMTNVMKEVRSTVSGETAIPEKQFAELPKVETQGNLSEIKKEILPSGETRYALPGTEGTATVGPERFFVGEKEVPKGTPGAVSGDELARQRILKEATPPELKLPEKGYYEAHPEERFMDLGREENKPLLDAYQKLIEENRGKAQGFGLPMNPKVAASVRAEATKAIPELTQGLEKTMMVNQTMPEKYFSSEARAGRTGTPHWTQDPKTGEVIAIYPPGSPGGKPTISPTGFIGPAAERSPTELGLISKSEEKGPDGKPTQEALAAQNILDKEEKRKINIQGGGIPVLKEMPPLPPGQKYNVAALEGVDAGVKETIKKVVNYDIPLPSAFALSKPYWQNIIGRASAYDPTFSALQYPVRFGVRKSFTSGKDKDNLVALNTAVGHIDSLVKAKDDLANSNWVTGNQAINLLAKYFPVTEGLIERQGTVTGVKTKFNAVKGEMANIFKKSGATDQEIKSWSDTIDDPSTATPTSWNAFINGSLELMGSRIEALRSIYERGVGAPKDFGFLSTKSRTILKKLGVDVNAIDPVPEGEPAITTNKPRVSDFGGNPESGGEERKIISGKSYIKRNGKWYTEG